MNEEWISQTILANRKSKAAQLIVAAHKAEMADWEAQWEGTLLDCGHHVSNLIAASGCGNCIICELETRLGESEAIASRLTAQVAIMAEALRHVEYVRTLVETSTTSDGLDVVWLCPTCAALKDVDSHAPDCLIAEALACAPQVLYRTTGRIKYFGTGDEGPLSCWAELGSAVTGDLNTIDLPWPTGDADEEVDVIILAHPEED